MVHNSIKDQISTTTERNAAPVVARVRHGDVANAVDGAVPGIVELATHAALLAEREHKLAVLREHLHPVVVLVHDDNLQPARFSADSSYAKQVG